MQAACAIIVRFARFSLLVNILGRLGWPLHPSGAANDLLTKRNKQGGYFSDHGDGFSLNVGSGEVLIAFAVLHVFSFAVF
jgi:hypothetical protein